MPESLLAAYVAAYGLPERHTPETGEWSDRLVCAEDAEPWPCRLTKALATCVTPPAEGQS